jgi:N-hydroxyarylamine O-acetyltransferase
MRPRSLQTDMDPSTSPPPADDGAATDYCARIGLAPDEADSVDRETLTRLQRAHVTTVPFETFSINGDPVGDRSGGGVSLSLPALYEKVVDRERGGFCFELNGAFGWLLGELGFDMTRLAARMVSAIDLPANHHPLLVALDRPYLVDVGMGSPMLRAPVPLDAGEPVPADEAGVQWRVAESDRPDADHLLQYRDGDGPWEDRYVFDTTPRSLAYFTATCDYLQSAPESGFVGEPTVTLAIDDGHLKLKRGTLSVTRGRETDERPVEDGEYHDVLAEKFGIVFPPDPAVEL